MFVLTVLTAFAALTAAPDTGFRWHGTLARGQTLTIHGINGDVRATAASGREVEVAAVKHARRSDPDEVEIKVVQNSDGVTICAIYPTRRGSMDCDDNGRHQHVDLDNNDVNVDFTIRVPAGVKFEGRTVNGEVSAEGLDADAEVSTVNGSAEVSTRGIGTATTVNGQVRAVMGRADWTGTLQLTTVNGNVIVELPADVNTEVHASTVNGDLNSDFPLMVQGRFGPRKLTGTIGRGGRSLSLSTVNGNIRIRRAG